MVARHSGVPKSLDDLIDQLPDRFWSPVPSTTGGMMTGLADYMTDLARWVQTHTGRPGMDLVPEIMQVIGAEPTKWYQNLLTE